MEAGYWQPLKRLGDHLTAWVRDLFAGKNNLDEATCQNVREQAWRQCVQGEGEAAVEQLQYLINRLESHQRGPAYQEQLALTFNVLASVYRRLNRLGAAQSAAEQDLSIRQQSGNHHEIANALGMVADLLARQQRYAEAESRYAEAFHAAQIAGEYRLQAIVIEKLGLLKRQQENYRQAVVLLRETVHLYRRFDAPEREMRAWDLLGTVETQNSDFDAAELSYARSQELAERLGDKGQLAVNAQNIGILYQKRAERETDPEIQTALLRQAVASVAKSLTIKQDMQNTIGTEASYLQLGILHWKLGEMDAAETYLVKAKDLSESLNLPRLHRNYGVLIRFAQSRGDLEAAAEWQAKYDAKIAQTQSNNL